MASSPIAESGSLKTEGAIPLTLLTKLLKIMKRYYVSITETLNKIVSVEANSVEEAVNKVTEKYHADEITLTSKDYIDGMVEVEEEQDYYRTIDAMRHIYEHVD
jgi:hypothetical protein|nr:MAG TPA: PcfM DpnD/PcfM-like protein [Caudoviricetes sp.]